MSQLNVDTIGEQTSTNGVTIDGLLIKDGISHSGLVKLASATASNSSELLFDNFVDTSTYSFYKLIMKDILPVNNSVQLRLTFRTGGASGSDLTGSYYRFNAYSNVTSAAAENYSQTTSTDYGVIGTLGNVANESYSVSADLFPAEGTYGNTFIMNQGVHSDPNSDYYKVATTTAIDSTTAVTGIKFYLASGNIASGSIYIYGVKK
jgi:hypothetical protein